MSEELQLRLSLHHRAVRLLRPLALILQRALRGLGLWLAPAFRRPRRLRQLPPQELHLENQAGGYSSEMVSTRWFASTRAVINALLQVVVRQSEPPTPTLGRSIAAFCTAGAAERLTDSENCEEHDLLQIPELVSTTAGIYSVRYIHT